MENKVADAALAMAQGVYRSARLLDRQLALPGIERDQLGAFGYALTSIVLRAFAVELALKALYLQETGAEEKRGHDLTRLFCALKPITQNSVERRFEGIRGEKINRGAYSGEKDPLHKVLHNHHNDFEEWRYFYEKVGKEGLHTEQLVLNSVVEAAVQEYISRVMDDLPDQHLNLKVEFNDQANRTRQN